MQISIYLDTIKSREIILQDKNYRRNEGGLIAALFYALSETKPYLLYRLVRAKDIKLKLDGLL